MSNLGHPDIITTTDKKGKARPLLTGAGGGGASKFTDLTDAPASYAGQAGKVVAVKPTQDGVEFISFAGGSGTPATTVVSETSANQIPSVGVSTNYAREDHTHGTPNASGGGVSQSIAIAFAIAL